ncbi:di-trans,poly-cis-decaprenylcistransferase [Candidatus Uhrbacteria bacterium]|mgnify:CR=1 FL=1|jgi:undecaprenyl diphosphate synthase|nr:di-trans,poly-cis-decaprenylcistransferase [Candidatus Uhrbacteria bacterium]
MSELNHIAIIPDGNRRWAREHNLPSLEGHRRGYARLRDVFDWCVGRDVKEVSVWAFSTENWKRTKEEVGYLMRLMETLIVDELDEFIKRDVRIVVVGHREDLSDKLRTGIELAEEKTLNAKSGVMNILFNYGGRPEIIEGVKRCLREGIDPDTLDEEKFSSYLWSERMSKPDLIIRTSGEQRLSGYLLWTGAYSEYYFANCHWPDFNEEELDKAIDSYMSRERRFGGDSKKSS